jgi:tetratricopeptide (TPR) repeat protein
LKKKAVSKQILILLNQLDEASYDEAKSILEGRVSHIDSRQVHDFLSTLISQEQPEMREFWIAAILEIAHGNKAFHDLPHLQKRYARLQENIAFDAWSREKLPEAATAFENASNAYVAAGMQSKWRKCCKNFATATTLVGKAKGQITDLETAISAYTECLDSLGSHNTGSLKAELFADIGYALLGIGQINNNHKILRQAAENYECALSILDEKDNQALWGRAQNSLGAVNSKLGDLTADANLIRYSISLYQDALRVRKIEAEPSIWLNTVTNISHCEFLLCGLTGVIDRLREKTVLLVNMLSENSNRQFGRTQIAHTYRQIASNYHWIGERRNSANDLRQAVFFYKKSTNIFTRQDHSYFWAQITSHVATALFRIGMLEDDTEMLEQSLSIHEDIKYIFDRKSKPFWWANWHRAVGDLNTELYKRENHHKYLHLAIEAYEEALKEYKKDVYPLQWAQTTRRLCLRLSQKPAFLRDWKKIALLSSELISSIHGLALTSSSKLQQRALLSSLSGVGDLTAAIYCHLKEYEKAFQYLSLSRAVSTELALRLNKSQSHGNNFPTSNWQRIRAKFDERLTSDLSGSGDLQILNLDELLQLEREHKNFLQEMSARDIAEPDYIKISQFTQNMTSDEIFLAVFVSECGGGVMFLEKGMWKVVGQVGNKHMQNIVKILGLII